MFHQEADDDQAREAAAADAEAQTATTTTATIDKEINGHSNAVTNHRAPWHNGIEGIHEEIRDLPKSDNIDIIDTDIIVHNNDHSDTDIDTDIDDNVIRGAIEQQMP